MDEKPHIMKTELLLKFTRLLCLLALILSLSGCSGEMRDKMIGEWATNSGSVIVFNGNGVGYMAPIFQPRETFKWYIRSGYVYMDYVSIGSTRGRLIFDSPNQCRIIDDDGSSLTLLRNN